MRKVFCLLAIYLYAASAMMSLPFFKTYEDRIEGISDWQDALPICRNMIQEYEDKIDKASEEGSFFGKSKAELQNELKIKLNKKNKNGLTFIFYAVMANDINLVQKMIDYGADVNEYSDNGKYPLLFFAISSSSSEIVKTLVNNKANCDKIIETDDISNWTPLMESIERGNEEILKIVYDKTSDFDIFNLKAKYKTKDYTVKTTPINYLLLCFNKYNRDPFWLIKDMVNEKKVDINSVLEIDNLLEQTPLEMVLESENINNDKKKEYIEYLLKKGANPNVKCKNKEGNEYWEYTSFHFAAKENLSYAYDLIKKYNGDKSKKDSYGKTPLDYRKSHIENLADKLDFSYEETGSCNDFLKDYSGAWESFNGDYNVVTSSEKKQNLLQIAIKYNDWETALKLSNNISWNKTDATGKTAKDYAFEYNCAQAIDYFLAKKIKLGMSLFAAIDNELNGFDSHIVDFINLEGASSASLLTKQILCEDKSSGNFGLLTYASYSKNTEPLTQERIKILKQLLYIGLGINESVRGGEYDGSSALIFASKRGDEEFVDFLLENGANVNATCKSLVASGRTALFYALENKKDGIVQLLITKGKNQIVDTQLNNSKDNDATLLMFFARYGNFEQLLTFVPELLSKNPISLEKKDKRGMTPFLYAAAYNNNFMAMKVLRMYGANVLAKDKNGNDAYDLAKLEGNDEEILRRLESYGVYGK